MVCYIYYPIESSKTHAFSLMKESAKKFGIDLHLKFFDYPINSLPEVSFIRGYNFELSEKLEEMGVKVVNSTNSMVLAQNKWLTYSTLKKYEIPQPTTYLIEGRLEYKDACQKIGSEIFILKSVFGSKGEKVWLVKDQVDYNNIISSHQEQFIIQKFIEESSGRDIRVWVAGGKVSAAVERRNNSSFRSNISCGGVAKRVEMDSELIKIAIDSTNALDLDIAGVDILQSHNGYTVCEVNGNSGFRSALSLGYNYVVDDMFEFIASCKMPIKV
ncbi:MAG: RimK family alpha-L-glutamate ligase [Rikenellaceae bacterium]